MLGITRLISTLILLQISHLLTVTRRVWWDYFLLSVFLLLWFLAWHHRNPMTEHNIFFSFKQCNSKIKNTVYNVRNPHVGCSLLLKRKAVKLKCWIAFTTYYFKCTKTKIIIKKKKNINWNEAGIKI